MECANFTFSFKNLLYYRSKRPWLAGLLLCCISFVQAQTSGSAISLNGTSQYADLGSDPALAATNIKTMECWVKFNNLAGNQEILSRSIVNQGIELLVYNNTLAFFCMNSSTAVSNIGYPTSNLQIGVWYHIAAAWNGTKESMQLYVNGKSVGTRTDNGDINTAGIANPTGTFKIGQWSEVNNNRYLNGTVDEVRIWNVARTASEIKNGIYGTVPTNTTGLLAYYKMNEGSGTTIGNSSTSSVAVSSSGTLMNGVTWTASPVQMSNNALAFDGVDDYVSIGAPLSAGASYTKEAWIYVTKSTSIPNNVISSQNSPLWISNGSLNAGNNGSAAEVIDPSPLPTNTWVHVAVTFDAATKVLGLYRNGNLVQSGTSAFSYTSQNNYIGAWFNGTSTESYLGGNIDEVRIWNVARTQAQIQTNMNTALTGNEAGLVAYYSFNQGLPGGNNTGLKIDIDGTANNNHGTLTNFALSGSTSNWIASTSGVMLPPVVTSVSPASGPVSSTVTITGNNFNTTAANNIVYFGATKATVTSASATSLTVTVPAGSTYQSLSVLNTANGLIGYASTPFIATYSSTGTFSNSSLAAKVDFATGTGPWGLTYGDIDGDSKPDMIVANRGSSTVSVYRNTSASGTINASSFAAKVDFSTGTGTDPINVTLGDIDGDGKQDLVVAKYGTSSPVSYTISVFRNTATPGSITTSSFATRVDFTAGTSPINVAISDVDGDGKSDLVVANRSSNSVSVLRNTATVGSITTSSFAAKVDFTAGSGPYWVAVGDLDSDGKPDLAVANRDGNNISVLRNTSTTGTPSFATKVDFAVGSGPSSLAIGDVDGDGKPDIAVANFSSSAISVLRNTATAGAITTSSFAAKVDFTVGAGPYNVVLGNIDGDNKLDMAVANYTTGSISILRNTATSGAITPSSFASKIDFVTGTSPVGIAIGDLDGDTRTDIAVANNGSNTVSVFRSTMVLLPVQFVSFTAQRQNHIVELSWSTASEQNSQYFEVERSANGTIYSTIGTVVASGNSNVLRSYRFTDAAPLKGNNFYRLKQVDMDGKSTYSTIQKVVISGEIFNYYILQNPVRNELKLTIQLPEAKRLKLEVRDARGTLLIRREQGFAPGNTTYTLPVTSLSNGTYFINIITEKGNNARTFVKQ